MYYLDYQLKETMTMAEYAINKGIGRPAEFKGLKSQYLLIFAGGLLGDFILFVILYMGGVEQWLCIALGVTLSLAVVWLTFTLNARYGEHGLMKALALKNHPRYITSRRRVTRLWSKDRKEGAR